MPSLSILPRLLLLLTAAAEASAQTFPNPQPCSGVCDYVHDPSVVIRQSDGTYFRFATSEGIQIATAPSLQGPWTSDGSVLPNGSEIPISGANANSVWAPDAHLIGDTYYVYYAVSSLGSQDSAIGVATSTSLDSGTWTDLGSLNLPSNSDYNLIDPNLFTQDGSSFILSFGSYWDGIYQIPLSSPLTISPGAAPQNIAFNPTDNGAVEGSYQFWWPTNGVDYFYLFLSVGICCNSPPNLPPAGQEYHVNVCRSTSSTGPFVDKSGVDCLSGGGTLVLGSHDNVYAPGGQGVIFDPNLNSIVLYYHYINPTIGYDTEDYQFGYNILSIDSDGWPFVSS